MKSNVQRRKKFELNKNEVQNIVCTCGRCKKKGIIPKCPLCLAVFKEESKKCVLSCQHVFHTRCIRTWLKEHDSCPYCRQDIDRSLCVPRISPRADTEDGEEVE